jgi:hypothetical protein
LQIRNAHHDSQPSYHIEDAIKIKVLAKLLRFSFCAATSSLITFLAMEVYRVPKTPKEAAESLVESFMKNLEEGMEKGEFDEIVGSWVRELAKITVEAMVEGLKEGMEEVEAQELTARVTRNGVNAVGQGMRRYGSKKSAEDMDGDIEKIREQFDEVDLREM